MEAEAGSEEAAALFSRSALEFEAAARSGQRPGAAWFNAGNAWFEAGEIGRSIAGYRQAEVFRPFDDRVDRNLAAARALAVDVVDGERDRARWLWPVRWLRAALVPVALAILDPAGALGALSQCRACCAAAGVALLVAAGLGRPHDRGQAARWPGGGRGRARGLRPEGPILPLPDRIPGAAARRTGVRAARAPGRLDAHRLSDGRTCWVPAGQVQLVFNPE